MTRQARLGLLVLVGIVVFIGALFLLAQRSFLLTNTYTIEATFNRVSGLLPGATVYYNGIAVGRVERVQLPAAPGEPITVAMAIRDDARHLIRQDSRAVIQTDGLVGNVVVALTDGSPGLPVVPDRGRVIGVDPLDLSQFSSRALESVARFDSVTMTMTQIMSDIRTGQGTLGRFLYDDALYNESVATTQDARLALNALTARADALVGIAADASTGVNSIIAKVNTGPGTLSRILNEDSVYVALLQASDQFSTISDDLRGITDRFQNAAGWASLGAFRFSENMEALKHNFLFKPYFEQRGYLEMAPFEVRERALAESIQELQEWERRLFEQQREIERARAEVEALRQTVLQRPPPTPAAAPATAPSPAPAESASARGAASARGNAPPPVRIPLRPGYVPPAAGPRR
ncbi:MAG: MlaD family protein [Rubricoccaceae bacterium]